MALLAGGLELSPCGRHLPVSCNQGGLGLGELRFSLNTRRFKLLECRPAVLPDFQPLRLLGSNGGHVTLELSELFREGASRLLGLCSSPAGPLQPFARRAQAAGQVSLLHLPVRSLLPSRLL